MGRLIDADALFKYNGRSLSDAVKYGNKDAEQQEWSYSTMMMYEIAEEIDNAPTVDAVPVVRCGECVYCDPETMHCDHPMSTALPVSRKATDYCSYGERREVADNG